MVKIGIVDTMFARVNMGDIAIDELKKFDDVKIVRKTVPGIKDIAPECLKLLTEERCEVCLALGMVGRAKVDLWCAHEASLGIMAVKLLTKKHVIEAFVHENEAWNEKELYEIIENRVRKHAQNAYYIIRHPEKLTEKAGKGIRQGKPDEGEIDIEEKNFGVALIVSKFNEEITTKMKEKAIETCKSLNLKITTIYEVPGSFDTPLAVKKALMQKKTMGVAVLGAIVKGGTSHDEVIAKATAKTLQELSLEFNKPVTLGIIGHNASYPQALERAEEYAERAIKALAELIKELRYNNKN